MALGVERVELERADAVTSGCTQALGRPAQRVGIAARRARRREQPASAARARSRARSPRCRRGRSRAGPRTRWRPLRHPSRHPSRRSRALTAPPRRAPAAARGPSAGSPRDRPAPAGSESDRAAGTSPSAPRAAGGCPWSGTRARRSRRRARRARPAPRAVRAPPRGGRSRASSPPAGNESGPPNAGPKRLNTARYTGSRRARISSKAAFERALLPGGDHELVLDQPGRAVQPVPLARARPGGRSMAPAPALDRARDGGSRASAAR